MQLSTALLLCFLILCATGSGRMLCAALGLRAGVCAAWAVAMLLLRQFPVTPLPLLTLNPAALLCAGLCCAAVARKGVRSLLIAVAYAMGAGLALMLLAREGLLLAEPALPLAIVALFVSLPMLRAPRGMLAIAALAPLCMELWGAGLELYAFGVAVMTLGGTLALNVQIAAVFLVLLLAACIRALRARRGTLLPDPTEG